MNRKAWWIVGIILTLIIGGMAYIYFKKDTPATTPQPTVNPPIISDNQSGTSRVRGTYVAYSPEAVSSAKGDRILFFHAPWCPQCREIEKTINNSSLPDNLTLFKVDYDSNQKLRQQYGVTIQTTFVKVDKDGNKVESYVAYSEPTFEAVKRELLP